jgi:threonine/homoserine/homoserine lactone efflux protein
MEAAISSATIVNGLLLGWSVAWPPGPVNAEIIRRGVRPSSQGGGFWSAYKVALGACAGDFSWALGVSTGAGAIIDRPAVRLALGVISFVLLLFLATLFARNAWRIACEHRTEQGPGLTSGDSGTKRDRGFLLGFLFVLTSPWGLGFWLAVIGSQSATLSGTFVNSLVLAVAVVVGALSFATVLCVSVKLGARVFARAGWQIATQALTAMLMLYFATRLAIQLRG